MKGNEIIRLLFHGFKFRRSIFCTTFGSVGITDRIMLLPNFTQSFILNIGTLSPDLSHIYVSEDLFERGTVDAKGFVFF